MFIPFTHFSDWRSRRGAAAWGWISNFAFCLTLKILYLYLWFTFLGCKVKKIDKLFYNWIFPQVFFLVCLSTTQELVSLDLIFLPNQWKEAGWLTQTLHNSDLRGATAFKCSRKPWMSSVSTWREWDRRRHRPRRWQMLRVRRTWGMGPLIRSVG